MGLPRSTYYDAPVATADEAEIVARIEAICEEFEAYGYRRVGAALRHQGIIVNSKKVRRLMREHDLQPRRRKRFVATTDSDHDGPIFPNLAKDVTADGPNQLWVADITYVAIAVGFVYVAVILDAWSRRVVGYAISRSIDARLTIAALKAAIRSRRPPAGCIHHSDRGSQYAATDYRKLLAQHGLVGSIRHIACRLERAPSTISREVRRNAATRSGGLDYRATTAQWHTDQSAKRPKPAKLASNEALRRYVQDRLAGRIGTVER